MLKQSLRITLALIGVFLLGEQSLCASPSNPQSEQLKEAVQATRVEYFQLYRSHWAIGRMKDKLKFAIEQAVDEEMNERTIGTRGIQAVFNASELTQKIQERFTYKFNEDYEVFLRRFEEDFAELYQMSLMTFYKTGLTSSISHLTTSTMQRAFIRRIASEKLREDGEQLAMQIAKDLDTKYKLGIGVAVSVGGMAIVLRRAAVATITKNLVKKTGGKLVASKLVSIAGSYIVPWVGIAMTVWGAIDVVKTLWDAPEELKLQMEEGLMRTFLEEVPKLQWESMEEFVADSFFQAHATSMLDAAEAERIVDNPTVQRLSSNLTEEQKIVFAERLAIVTRIFQVSGDERKFLETYGEMILRVSSMDFPIFLRMIRENPNQIIPWYELAKDEYFYLYGTLPSEIWRNYVPSEDSLKAITWIARHIPENAKQAASELKPQEVRWVMEELPERYVPDLFVRQTDAKKIQGEIARLASLSDKELRKPWQSESEYNYARYHGYADIFLKIVLPTLLVVAVLWLYYARKGKKSATDQTIVVQNIIPPTSSSNEAFFEKLGVQRPLPPSQNHVKDGKENKV